MGWWFYAHTQKAKNSHSVFEGNLKGKNEGQGKSNGTGNCVRHETLADLFSWLPCALCFYQMIVERVLFSTEIFFVTDFFVCVLMLPVRSGYCFTHKKLNTHRNETLGRNNSESSDWDHAKRFSLSSRRLTFCLVFSSPSNDHDT